MNSHNRPITAVIVGAGHRSVIYSSYALKHPEELKIVGVVDPNDIRRNNIATTYNIPEEYCFNSVEELVKLPAIADAAINGTMDKYHVPTTLPLLEAGYHVLLEKPIGISKEEVTGLLEAARSANRKVMICHVLRYAPFYVSIRKKIAEGEIGDILSIRTAENVSYHHMACAFIRGKWGNRDKCMSPMLMSKCCHDLDLLTWMKSGIAPAKVSSFGGLMYFNEKNAPEGSGSRCIVDCSIEKDCIYSAYKNYIEMGLWRYYAWEGIEHLGKEPTEEQKLESLRTDNPYGKCVWRSDNNVVDHQAVAVEYEDGSTATHNMTGGTSKPCRYIHIIGTKGEIEGVMEDGCYKVRHPDARKDHEYSEELIDINVTSDMHGGGDLRLVADFISLMRGEEVSISSTTLEDSIYGHMIGFAADVAMNCSKVVGIEKL
jgi:predicted dehydrogenase